jgi:hypothetical protein
MDRFLLYIYKKISRLPILLISAILMVGTGCFMYYMQLPKVSKYLLELQFSFKVTRALKIVAIWGSDGIDSYLQNIWLDFIYPLTYGLFFAGFLAFLALRKGAVLTKTHAFLCSLPILAIPFDYAENSLHIIMLSAGWIPDENLLLMASIASSIKWFLLALSALSIIYLFFNGLFTQTETKPKKGLKK